VPHDCVLSEFLYDPKRWVWETSSIVLTKTVHKLSLGVWYLYTWVSHRVDRQMHLSNRVQWHCQNFEIKAVLLTLLCCVVMLHLELYIGNLTEVRTQYVPWRPAGDSEFPLNYVPQSNLLQLYTTPFNDINNSLRGACNFELILCVRACAYMCMVCTYACRPQGRCIDILSKS
jgi:hypothetical protein